MKKNILRIVKMTAYYSFLGLVLQGLLVNILLAITPAEGQNLRDVKVTVKAVDVTLEQALQLIEQKTNFKFFYVKEEIPLNEKATMVVEEESLYNILEVFARDYGLTFNRINDQIVIRKNLEQTENLITAVENGTIKGKVTDAVTKEPLYGASVVLKGTTLGSYTDSKGNFEISNVKPGNYTVAVSYVGYTATIKAVTINANQTVDVNFALGQSAVNLNEVTVTGSLAERSYRESANPISIITPKQLENRNLTSLKSVLQEVPGIIPSSTGDQLGDGSRLRNGQYLFLNIRGFSPQPLGFTSGATKFIMDGVEVFDYAVLNLLDANQIEKIEISRGPMSTTLYGAGSTGGVIHLFTKKGQGDLKVSFRTMFTSQESYVQESTPLNTEYTLNIKGGEGNFGYNIGFDYVTIPSSRWGKNASPIYENDWSINAAINAMISNVKVDLRYEYSYGMYGNSPYSGYYKAALKYGWPGDLTRLAPSSTQWDFREEHSNQNASLNLRHAITDNIYHNLSLGISSRVPIANYYYNNDYLNSKSGAYQLWGYNHTSKNVKYFLNLNQKITDEFKIDATAGFDYLDQIAIVNTMNFKEPFDYNITQNVNGAYSASSIKYRVQTKGLFAEAVWGLWNDLFLTTGFRTEQNTSYGDIGWYSIPRIGLTYVTSLGDFTFKPRFAWGKSTQGVSSLFRTGGWLGTFAQILPNPDLQPQTQKGYEIGTDIYFTNNYSIGVTYYDQKIENLVSSQILSYAPFTLKYFNISDAYNKGFEFSGKAIYDRFTLDLAATFTNSTYGAGFTTNALAYNAEGSRILQIPYSIFYVKLTYDIPSLFSWVNKGGRISVDYRFTGKERYNDYEAYYKAYAATGTYPATTYREWDGYSLVGLRLDHPVINNLILFVDVKNLLNNQDLVAGWFGPLAGRNISFGFNYTY